MRRARTRSLVVPAVSTLSLCLLVASPAAAADGPEAAVRALFEAVSTTDLADLDGLVCSGQQEAVREAFSDAALGIDVMAESFGSMPLSIAEPEIELLTATDTAARAHVAATLRISVDDQRMREFAREIIEAGAGPDDPPVTDADIDAVLPFMADALGLDQAIEAEVALVVEDGEWVVCGGLGLEGFEPPDIDLADAIVSSEGLCALATPAELSELGSLEYDSSTGFDEFCTYSQSDWDDYHASSVSVIFDTTLDQWRAALAPDTELEIAGASAFVAGSSVFTEAGNDVLQVTVSLPNPAPDDVDATVQATRISELFLPRLRDFRITEPEPPVGPSLCDGVSLPDLNLTSGRAFDDAVGDPWFCSWSSSDEAAGLDMVLATVSDLTLDDFRELLEVVAEIEVEGQPGLATSDHAVVELPDGRTLAVSVSYDESVEALLPADQLALTMAERLLPEVPAEPIATAARSAEEGLLTGRDWVDDLCLALPYEELAEISGVPFEDPGYGPGFCEYYGGNPESGWHYALTSLEYRPISLWLEDYPLATSIEIDGQPAVLVGDALPDLDESAMVIVLVPGFDELTLAAAIGIDTSTGTEVDTTVVASEMAKAGVTALVGSRD